jgi:formylmethanofuran dehydrogenase subunit E
MDIQWILEKLEEPVRTQVEECLLFHRKIAPGILLGVYMVRIALKHMETLSDKMNAVAENRYCLPDVIQCLTGCTLGNRYLWVRHTGRFAICLYDRATKIGIRVTVDPDKVDEKQYPLLKGFFTGTRDYSQIRREEQQLLTIKELLSMELPEEIFKVRKVTVNHPTKPPLKQTIFCDSCGEYFKPEKDEDICMGCRGMELYSDF